MISPHFSRSEFQCKCGCGQDTVDGELLTILEKVRDHFGVPIRVTSGNRCEEYNRRVGGASKSQHLVSRAADIQVFEVPPQDVYAWLNKWHFGGLGRYKTFTHVDTRERMVRWGTFAT